MDLINVNVIKKIFLFTIYPFGAFLLSLKDYRSQSSRIIFYLWFIIFGYTFQAVDQSADSYRYVNEHFEVEKNYDWSQYTKSINEYFTFKSKVKDIYVLSCNYFVSRITKNYHLLFALFSSVFAFFYLKSFKFLTNNLNFKYSIPFILLSFIFVFSNPIYNINGVRFYTASWIAVYSIFQILVNFNYKYFALLALTPLVHVSYFILIALFPIIIILLRFRMFWKIMFYMSFLFSTTGVVNIILTKTNLFPEMFQNLIISYLSETNLSERLNSINSEPLYARILNAAPGIYINVLVAILIFKSKKLITDPKKINLLYFVISWISIFNIIGISTLSRFLTISIPLVIYIWVDFYKTYTYKYNWIIYLIPFVYSYQIFYWIKRMIMVTDPYILFSNPLIISLLS